MSIQRSQDLALELSQRSMLINETEMVDPISFLVALSGMLLPAWIWKRFKQS